MGRLDLPDPHRDEDLLRAHGYDPADPVPRDETGQRVIPDRLLRNLARTPYLPERLLTGIRHMTDARRIAAARKRRGSR